MTSAHKGIKEVELDKYWPEPGEPTSYAYTLDPNHPSRTERIILRLKATTSSDGTNPFTLLETGEKVNALIVDMYPFGPGINDGGPLYIPAHRLCLEVADHFVNSQDPTAQKSRLRAGDKVTSTIEMWELLYRRIPQSLFSIEWVVREPHDYFGGRSCRNVYWEPDDDVEHAAVCELQALLILNVLMLQQLHESNPVDISNLTNSVLQNLLIISPDKGMLVSTLQAPSFSLLFNAQNLDLDCEYTYSPSWWCSALCNKQVFPWLWDLDVSVVHAKQQAGQWNWELLVRQLSQLKIHEPADATIKLPLQLRNRRRIWRLLEEARINDIAGPAEEEMAMHRAERQAKLSASSLPAKFNPISPPGFRPKNPEV
jgi:hypothetical protein